MATRASPALRCVDGWGLWSAEQEALGYYCIQQRSLRTQTCLRPKEASVNISMKVDKKQKKAYNSQVDKGKTSHCIAERRNLVSWEWPETITQQKRTAPMKKYHSSRHKAKVEREHSDLGSWSSAIPSNYKGLLNPAVRENKAINTSKTLVSYGRPCKQGQCTSADQLLSQSWFAPFHGGRTGILQSIGIYSMAGQNST